MLSLYFMKDKDTTNRRNNTNFILVTVGMCF